MRDLLSVVAVAVYHLYSIKRMMLTFPAVFGNIKIPELLWFALNSDGIFDGGEMYSRAFSTDNGGKTMATNCQIIAADALCRLVIHNSYCIQS